jgi:polysaccharide deacetylase 2 family uncharacterized protein YibQ
MTKPTKRRRTKKRRPDFFRKNKFSILLMGLAALAVISLVFLARLEEQPRQPMVPPATAPSVDYTNQVLLEVEAFFSALNADVGDIQRDLEQVPARYTVSGAVPSAELIAGLGERLMRIPGDYSVRLVEANSLIVEKNRQARVVVQFVLPEPEPVFPAGPLVAIIMDDLGRSVYTANALISMPQHVTFSILPDEPQAFQVAELAHAAGREVMLHAPMEPQGYPAVNPGREALFVEYSDAEIRRLFDQFLEKVPHVSGTNNHMGSRFTEDARALLPVMESVKEKGLFFIDSRTTGRSLVPDVAQRVGVPTMSRDVFLDNVAEVEAISREIRRLEGQARRKGMAIGICHPYPETLEALRRGLPELTERGVTVVPVSVLLEKQALAQGN